MASSKWRSDPAMENGSLSLGGFSEGPLIRDPGHWKGFVGAVLLQVHSLEQDAMQGV